MKKTFLKYIALGALAASASSAHATNGMADTTNMKWEQCYGIAKAGHNTCPQKSTVDGDPKAFINVPAGTCDKIVGGMKK